MSKYSGFPETMDEQNPFQVGGPEPESDFIRSVVSFQQSLMLFQSDFRRVVAHVTRVAFFWACQQTLSSPPTCSA